MINYDVAIIGAGPAGLFAAHYILEHSKALSIALIEKGNAVQKRKCNKDCHVCTEKERCNILCGIGGSGLFSDGKLILDLHSGGKLDTITNLSEEKREYLKTEIVRILKEHDGKSELSPHISVDQQKLWKKRFNAEKLHIKHYDVLHMGTENLYHITKKFANKICENSRVSLKLNCEVVQLKNISNNRTILFTNNGEIFSAQNVIFAVGKTGSSWLDDLFRENGIGIVKEKSYIGIRVETDQTSIKKLFEYSFDPKIWAYYGSRKVKTHCFCRHGTIICTNYMGFSIVGGHTRFTENNHVCQSSRGNFNILVSTERSSKDILHVLEQFRQANPDGIVVQGLLEFMDSENGRAIGNDKVIYNRSRTGNIRKILDDFDSTGTIISDFILRISKIVPGILSDNSLIYAPAIEWFMNSVEVNSNMETSHKGWFAVGDGAGLSQGIVHAAATSMIAAEEICRRIKE